MFSLNAFAESPIKSLRSITHEQDSMYISSGREDNHSDNADKLNILWKSISKVTSTDSYSQDWKKINVNDIEFNIGSESKNYIVFHKNSVAAALVEGASLFKWGCDESIVPVLNLGKWPFKGRPREWEGHAIEISVEYGLPKIIPVNNDFLKTVPLKEKELIRDENFQPVELKWLNLKDLQIILVEYEHSNGSYEKELIVININTNKVNILKAKSPFDGRC